jgi:serine/threonine-protein kinase
MLRRDCAPGGWGYIADVVTVTQDRVVLGGRYELGAVVGRGATSDVYRARDLCLGREVAVKVLAPDLADDPRVRARFVSEARIAAALTHRNVVRVHDIGLDDGAYLVMEHVVGGTLADEIRRGPATLDRTVQVADAVLAALAAAHARGVLHRDIKPGNVLVTAGGGIRLTDFGIAVSGRRPARLARVVLGTPAYLAPERLAGHLGSVRSDLYAVGVLLYEMLAGRRPFSGESADEVRRAVMSGRVVPLGRIRPDLPRPVVDVVARAMHRDPARRYASGPELVEALHRARRRRIPTWVAGLAAVVALGAGAVADGATVPRDDARSTPPGAASPAPAPSSAAESALDALEAALRP